MGNEGQSPRDVASEKQKHPWEVFPDGEASTENGGKKRENKTDKKGKKFHLPKDKRFIALAIVVLILIGVGAYFGIKFLTEDKTKPYDGPEATVITSVKESISLDDAATPDLAYGIAATALRNAALEGANANGTFDSNIIMDNIDAYIKNQKNSDDQLYYEMVAVSITSLLDQTDIAKYYLEKVDKTSYDKLNKNQKYAYIISHRLYYRFTDDEEKYKEYNEMFDKEFPEDEEEYIEAGTNNVIEPSEEEKNQ